MRANTQNLNKQGKWADTPPTRMDEVVKSSLVRLSKKTNFLDLRGIFFIIDLRRNQSCVARKIYIARIYIK